MDTNPDMEKCRQELFAAVKTRTRDYLTIAELLHKAHNSNRKRNSHGSLRWSGKNYLQEWGYENLGDFAEKELGIAYRTAKTYVDIWEIVEKFNLPLNQARSIGRSKMALIVQVVDEYNWSSLFHMARVQPVSQIRSYVNMLKGKKDPEFLELWIPKKSAVYKAIQCAKEKEGLSSDMEALSIICSCFISKLQHLRKRQSLSHLQAFALSANS